MRNQIPHKIIELVQNSVIDRAIIASFRRQFVNSPNCQKPSHAGRIDRGSRLSHRSGMTKNNAKTLLIRVLTCLALVFAIVLFPPSAAHAGSSKDASRHVHSEKDNSSATHQASHSKATKSGSPTVCGSDSSAERSESGSNQCCSSICLTDVLIEVSALRHVQISSSQYIVGFTQLTPVDSNGFLRPPRLLI